MNLLDYFKTKDNILLESHNDLDGVGSIIIYKYFVEPYIKKSSIYSSDYPDMEIYEIEKYNHFDTIIFTDIAPSVELYNKLIELKKEVFIFDHHVTSHNRLEFIVKENYYYDINKCGTQIFYDEITKGTRKKKVQFQFVQLVNTFDLYQTESLLWNDAKSLSNAMYGMVNWARASYQTNYEKYEEFIIQQLHKFQDSSRFFLNIYEQELAKKADAKEKLYFAEAKRIMQIRKDNMGNTYSFTEAKSKVSWIAHLILKDNPELTYIVIRSTFNDKNGRIVPKVSVRSLNSSHIDCSAIADKYGCGGHSQAAGIEFKDEDFFKKFRKGEVHLI